MRCALENVCCYQLKFLIYFLPIHIYRLIGVTLEDLTPLYSETELRVFYIFYLQLISEMPIVASTVMHCEASFC